MMKKYTACTIMFLAATCFAYAADNATMNTVSAGAKPKVLTGDRENYNEGVAQFRAGRYDAADSYFERALLSRDAALEARAAYNLGNTKYKLAQDRKKEDLAGAVELLGDAVHYYKRAIDLAPKDFDSKFNFELVDREYRQLKEQLEKQPQDRQCKRPGGQDKEENRQSGSTGQQSDTERKQQQSPGEERKSGEQQEQNPGDDERQDGQARENTAEDKDQPQDKGKDAAEQGDKREMSKKEAEMLLDSAAQDERMLGQLDDRRQSRESEVYKDW
jgi:tetratricopeptide (TPR) repeat protein